MGKGGTIPPDIANNRRMPSQQRRSPRERTRAYPPDHKGSDLVSSRRNSKIMSDSRPRRTGKPRCNNGHIEKKPIQITKDAEERT